MGKSATQRAQRSEHPSRAQGKQRSQGYHPRGDRKSVEAVENRRDSCAPLRERVRNCMKPLELQGCDRKQRSWCAGESRRGISGGGSLRRLPLRVQGSHRDARDIPTPRHFDKRVCKLLKTKDRSCKKSGKRVQERAIA